MGPSARPLSLHGDRQGLDERLATVRKLHAGGAIDREIAEELGLHPGSAARLRARLGLEPNGHERKRGRRRAWRPDREAAPLYERGWNDREIAKELGVSRESVTKWRHENGLPSVGKPGPKPTRS